MGDMSRKILVADDEPKILQMVSAYLEAAGYSVIAAPNGALALDAFRKKAPDCVVLDINMPELDGLDVAREIRKISASPIIFLTARAEETDRIIGLELGADDYIVKPFSPRELVARVKAVLRRASRESSTGAEKDSDQIRCGEVLVDRVKRSVLVRGESVELTKVQFELLMTLIAEPGRVFPRAALLETTMGSTFEGYERTVDAHIKNLRKALGDDGDSPRFIGTVRGVGYKFLEAAPRD